MTYRMNNRAYRANFFDDSDYDEPLLNHTEIESFFDDRLLEKSLEKVVTNYLKGIDITSIVQRVLINNQEQIFGQLFKNIGTEVLGSALPVEMGNSIGQTMGHLASALQGAFAKYL